MKHKAELNFEVTKILMVLVITLMFSSLFAAYSLVKENKPFAWFCIFMGLVLLILFMFTLPKFLKSIDELHDILE